MQNCRGKCARRTQVWCKLSPGREGARQRRSTVVARPLLLWQNCIFNWPANMQWMHEWNLNPIQSGQYGGSRCYWLPLLLYEICPSARPDRQTCTPNLIHWAILLCYRKHIPLLLLIYDARPSIRCIQWITSSTPTTAMYGDRCQSSLQKKDSLK